MARIDEADAMRYVGNVARSTLWKWYPMCRVALTASKRPATAWDTDKLDARMKELARAQKRIVRRAS